MRVARVLIYAISAFALLYGGLCGALYTAMRQTPERFGAIMTKVPGVAFLVLPFETFWMKARAGTLRVGDAAPDFALPTLDHSRVVKLSGEVRHKPVVLIFGSYT